jgi:hypothetical protein
MSPRSALSRIPLAGVIAFLGCSSELPTTPAVARPPIAEGAQSAKAVAGSYQLSFLDSNLQPVSSLPACTISPCHELILGAHVEDANGDPAQAGFVTFQYCSYKGFPPNDISRADEAPSSACADGSATWANLRSLSVDASGNAYLDFGIVMIPRTIGFRFRYTGSKTGIANGDSAPADFTWTAP